MRLWRQPEPPQLVWRTRRCIDRRAGCLEPVEARLDVLDEGLRNQWVCFVGFLIAHGPSSVSHSCRARATACWYSEVPVSEAPPSDVPARKIGTEATSVGWVANAIAFPADR